MMLNAPQFAVERIEASFKGSDLEYLKVGDDGTLTFVFRLPEFCKSCFQYKSVFVIRPERGAECADCDVKALEPVPV